MESRTEASNSKGATTATGSLTVPRQLSTRPLYWARARTGRWGMWCKTRRASLRRSIKAVYDWCRSHRHLPIQAQREALERRVRGHYNYFGVSGNFRCLLLSPRRFDGSGTNGCAAAVNELA